MVMALGVTLKGEKVVLGFLQTSTENGKTCGEFLEGLTARGLRCDQGLLVILEGLHAAVEKVFDSAAAIQRCQWHERENVMAYLGAGQQTAMWRKPPAAYNSRRMSKPRRRSRSFVANFRDQSVGGSESR